MLVAVLGLPESSEVAAELLERAVATNAGSLNVLDAERVELIAQVIETGAWEGWGIRSVHHWVTLHCGVSSAHAHALVASARRLSELPETWAKFAAGSLSADQVAVIARSAPAYADAEVAELATHTAVPQLRSVLRRYSWPTPAEPKPEDEAEPAEEVRRVGFGSTETGTWRLFAELPADEGAVVETALRAIRDQMWRATPGEDREQVTWADALLGLVDAGAAHQGKSRAHRERYLTLLHLEATPDGATAARIHMGPVLPDSLRRYLLCEATVRTVTEIGGVPVNVGRAQHIVPDRTRHLVEHRDQGCRVPGCNSRTVHVHHVIHWENGGLTVTWNLTSR